MDVERRSDRGLGRLSWADSTPTEVVSGGPESGRKPAFRCEPEMASTAPSRHRPKPQQNVAMGGKPAEVRPRREFQSSVDHLPSTQSGNSGSALEATVPRIWRTSSMRAWPAERFALQSARYACSHCDNSADTVSES
jgi:hypothetical protein